MTDKNSSEHPDQQPIRTVGRGLADSPEAQAAAAAMGQKLNVEPVPQVEQAPQAVPVPVPGSENIQPPVQVPAAPQQQEFKVVPPTVAGQQPVHQGVDGAFGHQQVATAGQEPATVYAGNGGYTVIGDISAEDVITGDPKQYIHLDAKISEIVKKVQDSLVETGKAENLANARFDFELRNQLAAEIDRLALGFLLQGRSGSSGDNKIIVASTVNEIIGLGPLEPLWQDPDITEVIVNGPEEAYVERKGKLLKAKGVRFRSKEHLLEVCQRILSPLNRKLDVKDPLADGRLPDGSRVNAVHWAIAPEGPLLTIRRFPQVNRSLVDLVDIGAMDKDMAQTISWLVANKASTLVVGGTGSGKALDVETMIPTTKGFTRMGDLKPGDMVYDENGQPTLVTGAYDVMYEHPCYELEFVSLMTGQLSGRIVADAEHLWPVINPDASTGQATTEQLIEYLNSDFIDVPIYDGRARLTSGAEIVHSLSAITRVESRPVRCIKVSNPTHVFRATETYIPTHNTTMLNALSAAIPLHERVITIEDSLELRLNAESHVAAMEARPADASGGNSVTIRELVKNALRMRPDRIIVGEIRDQAALDMLQACNTGHEGSMSTVHANGPNEAVSRLAVMVAQGGEIPADKVDWLVGSALDLILMIRRYKDGSRRVSGLYEVPEVGNLEPGQPLTTIPIFEWIRSGEDENGILLGEYKKVNELSPHLRAKLGLDFEKPYEWDDVLKLSGKKPA